MDSNNARLAATTGATLKIVGTGPNFSITQSQQVFLGLQRCFIQQPRRRTVFIQISIILSLSMSVWPVFSSFLDNQTE